ncbi:MAG TPA: N-acetylmuramoyl-L-alanine amidase [Chloroflexia bacterium]|nr:N-acetylmuramoyl-L-alanine amidase [Chloroflexia bacterium]
MTNRTSEQRHKIQSLILLMALALASLAAPHAGVAFAAGSPGAAAGSTAAAPPAARTIDVAIQAGHWKANELPTPLARLRSSTGTSGGGRTEANLNLDIAQRTAALLRAQGLTVQVYPATLPTGLQAGVFVALHADGNANGVARGYKVSTRWSSEVAGLDAALVRSLETAYGQVTGLPHDTSVTRAMRGYYAYSTRRSEEYRLSSITPAAIVEMGFMTSAADRAVMFNQADRVARGIVAGVTSFLAGLPQARQLQALAERQAAASESRRSAVALFDSVNIRKSESAGAARVATAPFGASYPVLGAAPASRPPGTPFNSHMGTTLASAAGWYNIALSGSASSGYISRDVVVVQQAPRAR